MVTGVAKTGVVGLLRGARPGKTLGIRADMDALPQTEKLETPYRSQTPGVHHGCGRDAHVAMGLGTATVLTQLHDRLAGSVKFLFEPAEEKVASFCEPTRAQLMVEDGVLDNPHVWGELVCRQRQRWRTSERWCKHLKTMASQHEQGPCSWTSCRSPASE